MAKFTDSKGRDWVLPEITEGDLIEVRKNLGYDLHLVIDNDEKETTRALSSKGVAEMLWHFLAPIADERGISDMDLAHAMPHKVKEDAALALYESILSFAHGPEIAAKMINAVFRPQIRKQKLAAVALAAKKLSGD
jgi:hypothetical protein